MLLIRDAICDDARDIRAIYAYYVENTAVTFEYEVPTVEDMRGRIAATLERYPYLVAEEDGAVLGFAYAGPFKERAAYAHSCELSIYLARDERGRGLGRALYERLEERLAAQGILNLYACIADPIVEDEYLSRDSERFHARMGFERVGTFHLCGYKFGRWYNMCWMERIIGEHR